MIAWALDPNDPMERPRSWLEGSGCDALFSDTSTDDPIETAAVWNRDIADSPDGTLTPSTGGSGTTASSGSNSSATHALCCARAPTDATAGLRHSSSRALGSGPRESTCASSSRLTTGCPRSSGPMRSSIGACVSSTTPSSRRRRGSGRVVGARRASRFASRPASHSRRSSIQRRRASSASRRFEKARGSTGGRRGRCRARHRSRAHTTDARGRLSRLRRLKLRRSLVARPVGHVRDKNGSTGFAACKS